MSGKAFDRAVSRAVEQVEVDLTPEQLSRARERARARVQGGQDRREIALAAGRGGVRALMVSLIEHSSARGGALTAFRQRAVQLLSGPTGGITFELGGQLVGTMHLVECRHNHDLGAEFAKLRRVLPEERHSEIPKQAGALVQALRLTYASTLMDGIALIEEVGDFHEDSFKPNVLRLDKTNTTFYIGKKDWEPRAGIAVTLA